MTRQRLPALDGLRGLAILLVVAWHAGLPGMAGAGQAGVTLFFVLSGYLITSVLVEEHDRTGSIDFRQFYLRRAARLLPALLLMMAAACLVVLATHPANGAVALIAPLLYVANWVQALHGDMFPVQHTWTLAIEEQFYIVWPLLLSLLAVRGRRWVLYAVIAGIVLSSALRFAVAPSDADRARWGTDMRADALLFGCAIGLISFKRRPSVGWALVLAAAIGLGAMVVTGSPPVLLAGGLSVIAGSSALLVAGTAGWTSGPLTWPGLRWFGGISYGLYLWHPLLFNAFPSAPRLALVAAAVLIAATSWRWLEQPVLRSVRSRSEARRVVRSPGAQPESSAQAGG